MRETHDLEWLRKEEAEAFAALPEAYQNDSCLVFYYDLAGNLYARPAVGSASPSTVVARH